MSYADAMYTIKRAAELTGIPAATLRAWERRYGLGQPTRTESGYRLYDETALADIRAMQLLLDAGWAPRQAAAEVIRRGGEVGPALIAASGLAIAQTDVDGERAIAAFLAAASAMDDFAMRRALDQGFGRASFEVAFDTWLAPALRALGQAWCDGQLDIAAEHFASAAVMRRLSAAYESAAMVQGAPRVLVGLAPGAFHELGALAFATAARRSGLSAIYVGANLPEASWLACLAQEPVDAIMLSVVASFEIEQARSLIERVRHEYPNVVVSVGGPQASAFGDIAIATPGGIAESVQQLQQGLRNRSLTQRMRQNT